MYIDKLNAVNNIDSVLRASRKYVNEEINHKRNDKIVGFGRGEVLMKVGDNEYSAEVVVGNLSNNEMIIYDVVALNPIKIEGLNKADRSDKPTYSRNINPSTRSISEKNGNVNSKNKESIKYSKKGSAQYWNEGENENINMTSADVSAIQSIGRKSINDFTSSDIAATESFAKKYFREMGVKSPFFRAWFGDWRENDRTPVKVVTQKSNARGITKNIDTGWDIQVSGKVFNETGHRATKNQLAIPYLDYINGIVENAILLDSYTINKTKSENSLMMHSLYAVVNAGNGPELLKLYIEEMRNPNNTDTDKRVYQLQNIEKKQLNVQGSRQVPSPIISTAHVNTIADLFAVVKQNDNNFNPKPASKVVNADGTPKVVYHGTDEDFNVFDITKSRCLPPLKAAGST